MAAHLCNRRRGERGPQVAPLLGIELRGNASRVHKIAEHHREMAALSGSFDRGGDWLAVPRRPESGGATGGGSGAVAGALANSAIASSSFL